jgi:RNA polymerase sigma-70 factor (ECF subfamily)
MVNTSLNLIRNNLKHLYHADVDDVKVHIADLSVAFDQFNVEDILKLIQELPSGYNIVFNMFEIDGFSHKEIADELGVSVNTSKSQLLKARRYLRKELEELYKD